MKSLSLLLLAPLGAWAAAISSDSKVTSNGVPVKSRQFTLEEVPNPHYDGGDARLELIKAHTKYTTTLPPHLMEVVESNPDLKSKFNIYLQSGRVKGTVEAQPSPFYDVQYVVPVEIGTPPQKTHLNLDTGSADLWTFSTDTYKPSVRGQTLYRPQDSTTSKHQWGESWLIRYGDGSTASGIVYKDHVRLGDTYVENQAVQSAVHVSYDLSTDSFASGIIGMAKGRANSVRPTQQKTYLENVQAELAEPYFTINLQRGRPGNYNFGYVDKNEFKPPMQFSQIKNDASPFWRVPVSGYQVGNKGHYKKFEWDGVVDTGTTLFLAPKQIVEDYYAQVKGSRYDKNSGMMVFPCDEEVPEFVFGIGSYRGVVPGHYINYGPASKTDCYGGIQSSEGLGMSILGAIVLKAQFVVFDLENQQIGFANKALDTK